MLKSIIYWHRCWKYEKVGGSLVHRAWWCIVVGWDGNLWEGWGLEHLMVLIIFWTAGNSGQFSAVAGYWGYQRGWAMGNCFWLFGLVWVWFKWIWATMVNLQQLQGTGGISVGGHLAIGASKKSNGWGIEPALALCHPLLHISDANYNIWGHKYTNTRIQILIQIQEV